jgi:hypothetical protein
MGSRRERRNEILNKGSEIVFLSGWRDTIALLLWRVIVSFRTNEKCEKERLDLHILSLTLHK